MTSFDPPPTDLVRQCFGHQIGQAIYVATRLGIPDLLAERPRTAADLAQDLGADQRALRLLLRVLLGLDLIAEQAGGALMLSERGAHLTQDSPSLVGKLLLMLHDELYAAWGSLLHTTESGDNAFETALGAPFWEYLHQDPALHQRFDRWMSDTLATAVDAIVERYDFSPYRLLVDVGGGSGLLARAVLERTPTLRAVVFDLPAVIASPEAQRAATEPEGRLEFAGGSFFDSVPTGGDCYTLTRVLHDWPDDRASAILRACRAAARPGTRLLLIERLSAADAGGLDAALIDLEMMVLCGGGERNEVEFRSLLKATGFRLLRAIPTKSHLHILEAVAVQEEERSS